MAYGDTLMANSLVDLSHSLGKQIVIEGLHSELPLNNIKALDFDCYKSFFSWCFVFS
jgi:EAL domain-containing protein (putative c-di-GMP-specific phosphodiesterase class I)